MPEARVRLYRLCMCMCMCVSVFFFLFCFVSFSPDHFNPCVGGHCFCSALPYSLYSLFPSLVSLALSLWHAVSDPLVYLLCVTIALCSSFCLALFVRVLICMQLLLVPVSRSCVPFLANVGDRLSGASASTSEFTWVVCTVFIQGVFIMCP